MNDTKIISCVGGHDINVIDAAKVHYDKAVRKFRLNDGETQKGATLAVISFSGTMLNAQAAQRDADPIIINGAKIPTKTPQLWGSVDKIPADLDADYYIVSAMYVAARKALNMDTDRLLTMGQTVVDGKGNVIGTLGFNRN